MIDDHDCEDDGCDYGTLRYWATDPLPSRRRQVAGIIAGVLVNLAAAFAIGLIVGDALDETDLDTPCFEDQAYVAAPDDGHGDDVDWECISLDDLGKPS